MPYVHFKNTKSYEKCILPATKEEFMDKSSPDIEVISEDNSSGCGDLAVLLFLAYTVTCNKPWGLDSQGDVMFSKLNFIYFMFSTLVISLLVLYILV
jgi:hypothetical protein